MKIKGNVVIILISLATATVFISGGYGYWQKELKIEGNITVVKPVPVVIKPLLGQQVPLDPNSLPVGEEQPDSPADSGMDAVNPGQQNSQGDHADAEELIVQVEEPTRPEQTQPDQQAYPIGQINEESPTDVENKTNETVGSPKTESAESANQPQGNVGDNNATN